MLLERHSIPGLDGDPDVTVITVRPRDTAPASPALVSAHGGGFVMGSAEGDLSPPAQIATETRAVVVSVDYRLAPEHPYPAAVHDYDAALVWTAENSTALGIDRHRIAVGGVSAGAALAAAVALMARDREESALCLQALDIPVLDDRLTTASMRQVTDTPVWNRPNAEASRRHYLRALPDGAPTPPYAAPARAEDLTGLPPAYVSVCEFDPLRDEGIEYTQRLVASGVSTELHLFPGTFHGSAGAAPGASVSRRMRAEFVDALRRAYTRPS